MEVIIDIIVAIINVPGALMVPDDARVTALSVVMMGDIPVVAIMPRVFVAVAVTLVFPVMMIAVTMVIAVISPLVIPTVMFFVSFVMAFTLRVYTTCQTDDQTVQSRARRQVP